MQVKEKTDQACFSPSNIPFFETWHKSDSFVSDSLQWLRVPWTPLKKLPVVKFHQFLAKTQRSHYIAENMSISPNRKIVQNKRTAYTLSI